MNSRESEKKDRERSIASKVLDVIGVTEFELIDREPPDFELRLPGKCIALELTAPTPLPVEGKHYNRRDAEATFLQLQSEIREHAETQPKLAHTYCKMYFREPSLPTGSDRSRFVTELLALANTVEPGPKLEHVDSIAPYPALTRYLYGVGFRTALSDYPTWNWNYNADALDLQAIERGLVDSFQKKSLHRYGQTTFDEKWVVIVGGASLSQQVGLIRSPDLFRLSELEAAVRASTADKLILYDWAFDTALVWPSWTVYSGNGTGATGEPTVNFGEDRKRET